MTKTANKSRSISALNKKGNKPINAASGVLKRNQTLRALPKNRLTEGQHGRKQNQPRGKKK